MGFPSSSAGKESACDAGNPSFNSWISKIHRRRDRLPTPVFLCFPGGSVGKESTCSAGDLGSIPGLGRSAGEVVGYTLQYPGLDCIVHGAAKSWTQLSDFHVTFLSNAQIILDIPREPLQAGLYVLLSNFFLLNKIYQAYLYISLPKPWNQPFLQEALFLLVKMLLKTLSGNMGDQCVHDYWGVFTSRPFLKN